MRIRVDSPILAVLWIGVMGMLAFDGLYSPFRRVRGVALVWLVVIAILGCLWRRYWKIAAQDAALADLARHVRQQRQENCVSCAADPVNCPLHGERFRYDVR